MDYIALRESYPEWADIETMENYCDSLCGWLRARKTQQEMTPVKYFTYASKHLSVIGVPSNRREKRNERT